MSVKKFIICPECGYVAHEDEEFCPTCGAKLIDRCPQCGASIRDPFAIYCSRCGNILKKVKVEKCKDMSE